MKTPPEGATLFQVDGRTDMTKLIVTSHNFVNAPKKTVYGSTVLVGLGLLLVEVSSSHSETTLSRTRLDE